jgi:hypothetical protein
MDIKSLEIVSLRHLVSFQVVLHSWNYIDSYRAPICIVYLFSAGMCNFTTHSLFKNCN